MATKTAPDAPEKIEAFIENKAGEFAKPILHKLRELVHVAAPQLSEDWKWSAPGFSGNDLVLGLMAFKKHVNLFFHKGAMIPDPDDAWARDCGGKNGATMKFSDISDVDERIVKKYVKAAAKLDAQGVKIKVGTKKELVVPADLTAELKKKKNTKAHAQFDAFPYSKQKEFVDWITEAKRAETRSNRVTKTLEMLARGEGKNDKYRKTG